MQDNSNNYVIKYIKEAKEARNQLRGLIRRSIEAYAGHPSHNAYQDRMFRVANNQAIDTGRRQQIQARCNDVPDGYDDIIFNVVETVVSMVMGGPEQYKYDFYDKYQLAEDDFVDRMAAFSDYIYRENKIDSLTPEIVRDVILDGASYLYLTHDGKNLKIDSLDPANVLLDPYAQKTNRPRFRGFGEMTNWANLKDRIKKTKGGWALKTLSDADVYLETLKSAAQGSEVNPSLNDIVAHDLSTFYGVIWHSKAPDSGSAEGDTKNTGGKDDKSPTDKNQYIGDDVWVDYLWDYNTKTLWTVINERYIVKSESHPLRASVDIVTYEPLVNQDDKPKKHTNTVTVELDDPIVEFSWIKDRNSAYPTTPLWLQLDAFDDLCAAKSLWNQNVSIAGTINFVGTSYDAENVSSLLGVSGEFIEGVVGQISVLNKQFDASMLQGYITDIKNNIKQSMGAVDQYQLQSSIGNRATAEEVATAASVVSQRMQALIANMETSMAELMYKAIKLEVIFGFKDKPTISYPFNNTYGEMTRQFLASDFRLSIKLASSIKTEQIAMAKNALQVMGYAMNNQTVDQQGMFALLLPMILRGQVSATQARSLIKRDATNDLNVISMIAEAKAREAARQAIVGPVNMSDMDGMSKDELDQITNYAAGAPAPSNQVSPEQGQQAAGNYEPIPPAGDNPFNQSMRAMAQAGNSMDPKLLAQLMKSGDVSSDQSAQANQPDPLADLDQDSTANMPAGTSPEIAGGIAADRQINQ